jgi:CheY-like chemotaxis protein
MEAPVAVVVECDDAARHQMSQVLGEMQVAVVHARGVSEARSVAAELARSGSAPRAIVARATLPDGSGLEALNELAALFPQAHQVLISHYPKELLFSMPGFAFQRAEFLQAEFTDEQFRRVMQHALGGCTAGQAP